MKTEGEKVDRLKRIDKLCVCEQFSIERVNILCVVIFISAWRGRVFSFWHEHFMCTHITHTRIDIYCCCVFVPVLASIFGKLFFLWFLFSPWLFYMRLVTVFWSDLRWIQIANGFTQFWSNDYRICYVHTIYMYVGTHIRNSSNWSLFIETKCFYKDIILLLLVFFHSFPPFTNKSCRLCSPAQYMSLFTAIFIMDECFFVVIVVVCCCCFIEFPIRCNKMTLSCVMWKLFIFIV